MGHEQPDQYWNYFLLIAIHYFSYFFNDVMALLLLCLSRQRSCAEIKPISCCTYILQVAYSCFHFHPDSIQQGLWPWVKREANLVVLLEFMRLRHDLLVLEIGHCSGEWGWWRKKNFGSDVGHHMGFTGRILAGLPLKRLRNVPGGWVRRFH